jgi:PAS domain S-box-containing protein
MGLFFLLLGFWPAALAGQESALDFQSEWRWADYGRESGLLGTRVMEMLEDGDTLWALTDAGAFWYDEYSWHHIDEGDGVPDVPVTSISPTGEGGVVLVAGGQAYSGSTQGFEPLPIPGFEGGRYLLLKALGSPWGLVLVAEDLSADLVATFLLAGGSLREFSPPGGVGHAAKSWRARSGTVWISTGKGLFFLDQGEWRAHVEGGSEIHRFTALWETPEGTGFASQINPLVHRGLLSWNTAKEIHRFPAEGEYSVLSGTTTSDSITLVVYDSGDLRVLNRGRWVTPVLPTSRTGGLHFVYSDSHGDLWFATRRGIHLFRRSLDRWSEISFPFPDPRNRVNDLLVARSGTLWMATHGGLLRVRPDGSQEWIQRILGEETGAVTGLTQDMEGGIWVTSGATFTGAYRYHGGQWTRVDTAQGFTGGRVHRPVAASDGSVWLLALGTGPESRGAGVFRWAQGGIERWTDGSDFLHGRAYAFAEGPDGSLWFGLAGGAARFKDGQWTSWGRDEGLGTGISRRAFTVLPTDEGGALVGFGPQDGDGIWEVRPDGSVGTLNRVAGLKGVGVNELVRDSLDVIWASSDKGVHRLRDGVWAVLDGRSGLTSEATWPLEFRGDQVLIGTTGGGLQILDRSEETGPPPRVERSGPILVEGKNFRIRWNVFGWRGRISPELIQVRDRLPGDPWSDWDVHRELWTTDEDDYGWGPKTIQIQAKGLHGQLSEPQEFHFEIPSPIHLRPIFYIPVSLLGGVILALLALGSVRRRRNEEAIRERESTLRTLVDTAPEGIAIYDADADRFTDVNANVLQMTKRTREQFLATRLGGTSLEVGPDGRSSREFLEERVDEALAGETVVFEWTSRAEDGTRIPTEVQLVRLPSSKGRLVRFSVLDVTARQDQENRRKELEAQLRQSQKLEAVGQLTGGVAHDFNNLLTVIMGNLDLLRESQNDPDVQELLESALGAAERSALLTQRLLAFSRRQALDNKPIVLRELVESLLGLLRRSLGETIRIQATLSPSLWLVSADFGQLEHAIINLAVNARDAMSKGGDLFLEGTNLVIESEVTENWGGSPGEYVCLSVTDTGVGMEPAVRDRAIDPFFTTKEVGAGSGLGLSMVYGFVSQSGGFIKIYSEPGRGTAVQLFLPRYLGDHETGRDVQEESREVPMGQGEVVLVVEDEPLLLKLSTRLCERLGYEVIPTVDAESALDFLEKDTKVDLLFSDVVLPGGRDGIRLALRARELRPDLPVLFTSGYAQQSILKMAREIPDFQLIPKPFDSGTLARRIRSVLEPVELSGTETKESQEEDS